MIMLRKQQLVDGVIGKVKMNSRRFHTHPECEINPQDRYWCGYCDRKGLNRISVNTDMILERHQWLLDNYGVGLFINKHIVTDKRHKRLYDYSIQDADNSLGYIESDYWSCENGCEIKLPVEDDRPLLLVCINNSHKDHKHHGENCIRNRCWDEHNRSNLKKHLPLREENTKCHNYDIPYCRYGKFDKYSCMIFNSEGTYLTFNQLNHKFW